VLHRGALPGRRRRHTHVPAHLQVGVSTRSLPFNRGFQEGSFKSSGGGPRTPSRSSGSSSGPAAAACQWSNTVRVGHTPARAYTCHSTDGKKRAW
jgi:hypothetical protein